MVVHRDFMISHDTQKTLQFVDTLEQLKLLIVVQEFGKLDILYYL